MHAPRRRLLLPTVLVLALVTACGGSQPTPGQTDASSAAPSAAAPSGAGPTATPNGTPRPTPIPVATGTPLGDRLAGTVTVPQAPCAMATDATSAWITGSADGVLVRVDPTTNAVVDTIQIGGGPCGVAVGPDGRIWVAILGTGSIVAVDPATKAVTGRIDDVGPALWDLKAGFGSIWVVDRKAKALLRVDPATAKVVATIPIGPQPSGLAVMPAGVWVSDDTDYNLRRIDPATNTVATTVKASGAPSWFSDDGATHLVVAERGLGKVLTVDPSTGALGEPWTGWHEPLDGTVVGDTAWIPEGSGRQVGVVDLSDGAAPVVRYALPGAVNPFVAEPGFGDVWVLDFSGTTVWRIRP
jgi:YVTN family beta-propeller protein